MWKYYRAYLLLDSCGNLHSEVTLAGLKQKKSIPAKTNPRVSDRMTESFQCIGGKIQESLNSK